MRILCIHNIGHDCGAAAFEDGTLLYSIEAERLTRQRYEHKAKPAVEHLLAETNLSIDDFDLITVSAPVRQDLLQVADYDIHLAALKSGALHSETECVIFGVTKPCLLVAHEVCHAACSVQQAGAYAENAVILVNEGRGLWGRASLFTTQGGKLSLRQTEFLPWYCTGFGWSALGDLLGFGKSPGVAGHLMAIAAYAAPSSVLQEALLEVPSAILTDPSQAAGSAQRLEQHPMFGRDFDSAARILATLQSLFAEELIAALNAIDEVKTSDAILLSGGCALNIVANTQLRRQFSKPIFIPPYCNDSGQALGAGLYALHFVLAQPVNAFSIATNGSAPRCEEVSAFAAQTGMQSIEADPSRIGALLAEGKILGICQGVSDLGPRSLGNRSILASADHPGHFTRISRNLKRREWYRPVCASFTEAGFAEVWPQQESSPHMMYSYDLPNGTAEEARHVDGTCRAHTVSRTDNAWFHDVLLNYETLSGNKGVINTSLNSAGRAMVMRPKDILADFAITELDGFVVGERLFTHA